MRKTSLASDTFHHSVGKENTQRSGFGCFTQFVLSKYRGENKGLFVFLSRTQAGPGRTVKQEQEEISPNHVQTFILPSVEKIGMNGRLFPTVCVLWYVRVTAVSNRV